MVVVGLLGREYDWCVRLLKVQVEDRGHKAIVINLTHLPRVTRASLGIENLVYDGYNLLEMDSFYLREMAVREPFFHVTYTPELWGMLREKYLSFVACENHNILFVLNLLEILARGKPMINKPDVYTYRTMMPYQFYKVAQSGFSVLPFSTGPVESKTTRGSAERLPLSLDEKRTYDVLSFPKNQVGGLRICREKKRGTVYRLIFLRNRLLEHGLVVSEERTTPSPIRLGEAPLEVTEAALKAAMTMNVAFAEVSLAHAKEENRVDVLQVDPSPEFHVWEKVYDLPVAAPLAEYLIDIGA